jgi:hypothetical protein
MAAALRINVEKSLNINSTFLSPRIGCGQMLTRIPKYQGNDILIQVMRGYNLTDIHADKPAAKILEDNPDLMRTFCANAEAAKTPIKQNFRGVYGQKEVYLVLDLGRSAAWFLTAPDNRLALVNYFRDAMPSILKAFKLTLGGSTNRLQPVGWQSLHDIVSDVNFRSDYPLVDRLEVMASLATVRWRQPVLEIGVNLLNFSDLREIRDAINAQVKS